MERPLGAQISHMLKDRGVTHVFGIPGVHNQELYRGIEEAGLVHVLARHEQGAGFMADGYARACGRPGVAYVITGPGLCNIMTPMGQAYSDSVPMLVISSCLDETAATRGQLHQMLDQRGAGAAVADWSHEARDAKAAYALVDRALAEFEADRPRPKHITVPIAALQAGAAQAPRSGDAMDTVLRPGAAQVADLLHHLEHAKKPLFVFGGGCHDALSYRPNAALVHNLVRDLVRRSGAAAFMTYAGRGLLAPDDPLSFGSNLGRPSSADVFGAADLLVVFGSELSECDFWRDSPGHDCPVVRVDLDPEVLAQFGQDGAMLRCDAGAMMQALLAQLPESAAPKWDVAEIAARRAQWRAEIDAERPGIVPVADALRDCLPEGTMIYSDMCQFAYAAKEVWDMEHSGFWHHPTGFGTLGYATPAAIGGAVARPGLPTMAIIGDYGFQYTVAELATAVELELPLVIFLWDNGKLGEIEDSMVRAQIAPNAVVQRNPDFLKLAQAYGAHAAQPRDLEEMQAIVAAAFDADRPTLIRVTSDIAKPD